ncbi:MAG: hypothetical protein AAF267_01445 [Deinococcota bacterium]
MRSIPVPKTAKTKVIQLGGYVVRVGNHVYKTRTEVAITPNGLADLVDTALIHAAVTDAVLKAMGRCKRRPQEVAATVRVSGEEMG